MAISRTATENVQMSLRHAGLKANKEENYQRQMGPGLGI